MLQVSINIMSHLLLKLKIKLLPVYKRKYMKLVF